MYRCRMRKHAWEVVPLGVCWTIWNERNRRAFDSIEGTMEQLKIRLFACWQTGAVNPWMLLILLTFLLCILSIVLVSHSLIVYFQCTEDASPVLTLLVYNILLIKKKMLLRLELCFKLTYMSDVEVEAIAQGFLHCVIQEGFLQ